MDISCIDVASLHSPVSQTVGNRQEERLLEYSIVNIIGGSPFPHSIGIGCIVECLRGLSSILTGLRTSLERWTRLSR